LEDYATLYEGQWNQSVGGLFDSGMLTNYTQDLLFSMERLSANAFSTSRIKPSDALPFSIPSGIADTLSGLSIEALQAAGRLFYVNYSSQASIPISAGKFAAASEAYFYIDPKSGDYLPLAIKPNAGSDLIYSPLDEPNDWLLAKMMFNQNDLWYTVRNSMCHCGFVLC
jgi:arachidonate 15-lipoxygenase (second type)/8-lipoxygenase (S-type)